MAKGLTPKQEKFCQEYLIDLNATQAAIRAGYRENTAKSVGSENLTKPDIQTRLKVLMDARAKRTEVTADRVLKEYARIAFFDIRKIYDDQGNLKNIWELDDDAAAGVVGIDHYVEKSEGEPLGKTTKIKIADKKGALDSIGRHLGMFTDKHEIIKMPLVKVINMTGKKSDS